MDNNYDAAFNKALDHLLNKKGHGSELELSKNI